MNWSGGKDACLSLYRLSREGGPPVTRLLTTVAESSRRVSMHGVREVLLREQALSLGLPLEVVYLPEHADMETYDNLMAARLEAFRAEGITGAVFGDIFLEDLRVYREQRLGEADLQAVFPLWGEDTVTLAHLFLGAGFKAVVTAVNAAVLDESFAGRAFDDAFLSDLPPNVDPCGENGEFHSFVYDGPLFSRPVAYRKGGVVERGYPAPREGVDGWDTRFFFCDLLPGDG